MADWPNQLAGLDLHTDICEFLIKNAGELFGTEEIEEEEKRPNGCAIITDSMEKPKKEDKKLRQKRNSMIQPSALGNEPTGFEQNEGAKLMPDDGNNIPVGSPRWRRFLQNTSHSLEHSFNTILRRPSAAAPSTIASSPQMGKRLGADDISPLTCRHF
jgi:hypothetical protein